MVQRKVPNKYGIQIEPVKGEKGIASCKPTSSSSSLNQDGKNRGADLKKKMKKSSRPIKLSDYESLTSPPFAKNIAQPGKPPPLIQQKQPPSPLAPLIRTGDGSPNYMKSTSCFDARKEVSQVSTRKLQISSDDKNNRRRSFENSVHGSVSSRKPTKCLSKSSSFKLVRTLTKTPSFKPTRGSLKKSSRVALCADMDAQRATCSSTLKDSKFPAYLMLSPGGTESEGTSAMKVCPYTYCSLNGHRHAPLPPLKCFLSARRRFLKTQKSLKSGDSSPRKVDAGMAVLAEKIASEDLGISESSPLINGSSLDFFVEVYAKNKEDCSELDIKEGVVNEDSSGFISFEGEDEEAADNENGEQFEENVSDRSLDSEVDSGEEITEGGFFHGNDYEDDAGSTDTEMEEWEEQQFLSMEADALDELEDQSNSKVGVLSEKTHSHDGELFESGDVIKDCKEVFFTYELEFRGDFEELFYVGDSDLNRHQNREVEESSQVSESINYDQLSYTEDAFDDMDATEDAVEKAEIEYAGVVVDASPSTEELIVDSELTETPCVTEAKEEASINEQEIQDVQVDGTAAITLTGCGLCLDVTDRDFVETNDQMEKETQVDDAALSFMETQTSESCLTDAEADHGVEVVEDENCSLENADECLPAETQDQLSDEQCQDVPSIEKRKFVAEQDETESSTVLIMTDFEEPSDLMTDETCLNESSVVEINIAEGKKTADLSLTAKKSSCAAINSVQELPHSSKKLQWNTKCKRLVDESEDPRNFNPREPNYLPLVPDPEAEKVDLKHQLMDDRKNAEEWMLDHALQQTVTKLAPARKKKVALLVEAFESVMPTSKCETHMRYTSGAFTQPKPIQACF